jgi:hypothetical protein
MYLKLSGREWDWTLLAQDRSVWQTFLFSIINTGCNKLRGIKKEKLIDFV